MPSSAGRPHRSPPKGKRYLIIARSASCKSHPDSMRSAATRGGSTGNWQCVPCSMERSKGGTLALHIHAPPCTAELFSRSSTLRALFVIHHLHRPLAGCGQQSPRSTHTHRIPHVGERRLPSTQLSANFNPRRSLVWRPHRELKRAACGGKSRWIPCRRSSSSRFAGRSSI